MIASESSTLLVVLVAIEYDLYSLLVRRVQAGRLSKRASRGC